MSRVERFVRGGQHGAGDSGHGGDLGGPTEVPWKGWRTGQRPPIVVVRKALLSIAG